MITYSLAMILTIGIYYIFRKNKKVQYIFSAIPLFIISAIRYDVGTDYFYRYVPVYKTLQAGRDVENLEIGFKILVKLLNLFSSNYQILFIVTSFIVVFGIFKLIFKYSKKPAISIILFFILGYYFESMNLVRQYMALVISMFALDKMIEKKYSKYIVLMLIATTIHSVAIVSCLYFVIDKIKIKFTPKYLVLFIIVFIIFKNVILDVIIYIISNTRFYNYANTRYFSSDIPILLLLVNLSIYAVLYYFCMIKKDKISSLEKLFLNLQFLAVVMCILGDIFMIFNRVISFFSIFQIISIPNFIELSKNETNKCIYTFVILLIFSSNIIYTNVINNSNEVVPYKTILSVGE